jgi:hypothetical protein
MARSAAAQFVKSVKLALAQLPYRTSRGVVQQRRRRVHFGAPSGNHDPVNCWVYSPNESEFEFVFAFFRYISPGSLICKVIPRGTEIADGDGASLQLNGDGIRFEDDDCPALYHRGDVTIGSRISRAELSERIEQEASEASSALGGIEFPFYCGSTGDIGSMLDRLFLYAYAIEQAKRALREESPLPSLYGRAPLETRAVVVPERRPRSQGFVATAAVRRCVELRAMEVARRHLSKTWLQVEDVSATHSFDLLCRMDRETLHVEVKGTTQDGSAVLLTRNEVEHAMTHKNTALIVVSEIAVSDDGDGPVARGGRLREINPWRISDGALTPMSFAWQFESSTHK